VVIESLQADAQFATPSLGYVLAATVQNDLAVSAGKSSEYWEIACRLERRESAQAAA
jgi:hypothetical protein